ncbi:MAG: cytochrome b [Sphingomonadales bacterium]|nr:cytochrome b [Sphingomonadales bacterium]
MLATAERYNRVARALHAAIAVLILANLLTGFFHKPLDEVLRTMPFHKASGLTILVLSLARLGWRLTWTAPALPQSTPAWMRLAARAVHLLFYPLMIVMPLSGWIVASASDRPLTWFGLFPVAKFAVTRGDTAYVLGHEMHELLGWLFAALVVLHVVAALYHHFAMRDGLLRRMW